MGTPCIFCENAYVSAQRNYIVHRYYDRELLAVYSVVKRFRHMVEGSLFAIYTDHKPLTFAFAQKLEKFFGI